MGNFDEIDEQLDKELDKLNNFESNNQEENKPAINPKKDEQKTNSWLFHFLHVFGFVFLIFVFFYGVYYTPISVLGTSMQPTINQKVLSESDDKNNDTVLYRKADSYNISDIVIVSNEKDQYIAKTPTQDVDFMIKRVVARPGDTITFHYSGSQGSKIYYIISVKDANGVSVDLNEESYIKEPMYFVESASYGGYFKYIAPNLANDSLPDEERKTSITISEGKYFVMGDNRNHSGDSRQFGQVAYEDICGSVRIVIKNGENVWIALLKALKESLLGSYNLQLKEYLWKTNSSRHCWFY